MAQIYSNCLKNFYIIVHVYSLIAMQSKKNKWKKVHGFSLTYTTFILNFC